MSEEPRLFEVVFFTTCRQSDKDSSGRPDDDSATGIPRIDRFPFCRCAPDFCESSINLIDCSSSERCNIFGIDSVLSRYVERDDVRVDVWI
jgi:hypothetical protein